MDADSGGWEGGGKVSEKGKALVESAYPEGKDSTVDCSLLWLRIKQGTRQSDALSMRRAEIIVDRTAGLLDDR